MTVVNIYGPFKEAGKEGKGKEEGCRLRRIHKEFYTTEVVSPSKTGLQQQTQYTADTIGRELEDVCMNYGL